MAENLEVAAMIMAVRVDEVTRNLAHRKAPDDLRAELLAEYENCYKELVALSKKPKGEVTSANLPGFGKGPN